MYERRKSTNRYLRAKRGGPMQLDSLVAWDPSSWASHTCNTHVRWETPRGRYDECSSKFSLSMKPRLSNQQEMRSRLKVQTVPVDVEPAHNTTKLLCPNLTVRLSISLTCGKQRIRRIVWKNLFACRECKRTLFEVDCITRCKRMDQGPLFTSGVSP